MNLFNVKLFTSVVNRKWFFFFPKLYCIFKNRTCLHIFWFWTWKNCLKAFFTPNILMYKVLQYSLSLQLIEQLSPLFTYQDHCHTKKRKLIDIVFDYNFVGRQLVTGQSVWSLTISNPEHKETMFVLDSSGSNPCHCRDSLATNHWVTKNSSVLV